MFQPVTREPTALPGTVADQRYVVRNRGNVVIQVVAASAAPPADSRDTYPLAPFQNAYVTPEDAERIYVWTNAAANGEVFWDRTD